MRHTSRGRMGVIRASTGGGRKAVARVLLALGSLAGLLPVSAVAAPGDPVGTEFQVNSYTKDFQLDPSVGVAPSGSFVVVWTSENNQDGADYGVFGQRFTSAGSKAGSEFQVNSYTRFYQYAPSVGVAANGSFVVVWKSTDNQDGDGDGVFGQRFTSDGSKAGSEFQVNTYTTSKQDNPSVGVAADGRFVVAWRSDAQDGSVYGVFGQRFTSDGSKAGTEFQVNSYTTYSQYAPSVGVAANGSFVVAWRSNAQDGSGSGVFGQRFAGAPTPAPAPALSHTGLIGLLVLLSGVGCWRAARRRPRTRV